MFVYCFIFYFSFLQVEVLADALAHALAALAAMVLQVAAPGHDISPTIFLPLCDPKGAAAPFRLPGQLTSSIIRLGRAQWLPCQPKNGRALATVLLLHWQMLLFLLAAPPAARAALATVVLAAPPFLLYFYVIFLPCRWSFFFA